MRKIGLIAIVISQGLFAQSTDYTPIENRKHEVRFDAIRMIADSEARFTYEYVGDDSAGYGVYIRMGFKDFNSQMKKQSYYEDTKRNDIVISPFYRFYFSKEKSLESRGFFVDGSLDIIRATQRVYINRNPNVPLDYSEKTETNVGIGFGLGWKWVNSKGIILDLHLGIGRNFSSDSFNDFYKKGGISVGYRF
ncbi:hypothetical protein AB4865_11610 [Capnocytophaga sp. ARDL2]|uniref:hypothetical protein n=1 Tax=Capnocytophaga sp. ARDL2 TaxID=3238809 RepID=UPI003556D525